MREARRPESSPRRNGPPHDCDLLLLNPPAVSNHNDAVDFVNCLLHHRAILEKEAKEREEGV